MDITTSFGFTINSGITTLTFTDNSTYTDPLRANVGVFVEAAKVSTNGTEAVLTLTPDTEDETAVTNWTTTYSVDGWYKYRYAAVEAYDVAVTYAIYDAVYDPSDNTLYRSLAGGNLGNALSSGIHWEEVTLTELVEASGEADESLNIEVDEHDEILYFLSQRVYGDLIEQAALKCCDATLQPDEVEEYELMAIFVNAMNISNTRQRYSDGEKIALKASNITV